MNLEQRSKLCNIEVTGVPTSKNESTEEIMKKIAEIIGILIQPHDIVVSHRVSTKTAAQAPNIICQLRDRRLKSQWMVAYKSYLRRSSDTKLTAAQIHNNWTNTRIYLNFHLTIDNKRKLHDTKSRAQELGYKYVWVNNDAPILIRKNENTLVLAIRSSNDIARLTTDGRFNN